MSRLVQLWILTFILMIYMRQGSDVPNQYQVWVAVAISGGMMILDYFSNRGNKQK